MDEVTLIHYPFVGRSLLIRLLCAYGDIKIDVQTRPIESTNKEVLPVIVTRRNKIERRIPTSKYLSELIPTNQMACRAIAKSLHLLGLRGSQTAVVDYIVALCNVDCTMALTGHLKSKAEGEVLSSVTVARLHNALLNIESHLNKDGRLFSDQLTLAEFAIYEVRFWLTATDLVSADVFEKRYPKIHRTYKIIREHERLEKYMKEPMVRLKEDIRNERISLEKLALFRFPIYGKQFSLSNGNSHEKENFGKERRQSHFNPAFYTHVSRDE